jgi:UDPglucose--hexose-1-phosphate uridylyltransferase
MVIIAEERAARPHQFDITGTDTAGNVSICPFCEGNESRTPGELAAFRPAGSPPDTPGWTVRTVPNKYPAVLPGHPSGEAESGSRQEMPPPAADISFRQAEGIGLHEVIIDTPRHVFSISGLTVPETAAMLAMYRQRLAAARRADTWAYVQIFKNVGAAAGASLPHSHSQLIAMPFIPPSVNRLRREPPDASCFWCRMVQQELKQKERIVEETEHFTVLCPFVSRFAGETEIYPKSHESAFDRTGENTLAELAEVLRRTIQRLEKAVFWMKGSLAYNVILNTEPLRPGWTEIYHWHFSVLPSLARAAGFEWGTGLHINPVSPEQAAKRLRGGTENEN